MRVQVAALCTCPSASLSHWVCFCSRVLLLSPSPPISHKHRSPKLPATEPGLWILGRDPLPPAPWMWSSATPSWRRSQRGGCVSSEYIRSLSSLPMHIFPRRCALPSPFTFTPYFTFVIPFSVQWRSSCLPSNALTGIPPTSYTIRVVLRRIYREARRVWRSVRTDAAAPTSPSAAPL
ncbi:hypothetical protein B0H13DRAFT_121367 [Mycena leptocephala]|nr:hypothetical protein B0H13DRAFT_121367 [Mycena leptocephala]